MTKIISKRGRPQPEPLPQEDTISSEEIFDVLIEDDVAYVEVEEGDAYDGWRPSGLPARGSS